MYSSIVKVYFLLAVALFLSCSFGTTTSYPFSTYGQQSDRYIDSDVDLTSQDRYIDNDVDLTSQDRYMDSLTRLPRPVHHYSWRPSSSLTTSSSAVINVDDFTSAAHGDHTKAFKWGWDKACNTKNAVLVVPKGNIYTLKQITFSGPCVSPITVQIYGTMKASDDISGYEDRKHWIKFINLQGITILGGGVVDGSGAVWWENSCKINPSRPCTDAPTALTFYGSEKVMVREITLQNAQQMHLRIEDCVDATTYKVKISSPGDSPNTDGIHVSGSTNVLIQSSVIATGDDCISIVNGSKHIQAIGTTCGPGHGISIGSLGKNHSTNQVSDVLVSGATLSGTTNGVRIKSWQGGSGYADDITFTNVVMHNVSNPIIINQNYCDQSKPCQTEGLAVQVRNVRYSNIRGTSNTEVAIDFDCSKSYPCTGIVLQDVKLTLEEGGDKAEATCKNVLLKRLGDVYPHC